MKKFIAFTLAEILIVLGIVGIVCELTIPTLVANYQKQVYVSSLQTFYTEFSQVVNQVMADSGNVGDMRNSTDVFAGSTQLSDANRQKIMDLFDKYLKYTDKAINGSGKACKNGIANNEYYTLGRKTTVATLLDQSACYNLTNGMFVQIATYYTGEGAWGGDCANSEPGAEPWGTTTHTKCATVTVDTNGTKAPNEIGRDLFRFFIMRNGKLMSNASQTSEQNWINNSSGSGNGNWMCNPANSSWGNGLGCSGRIIDKGWVMDY